MVASFASHLGLPNVSAQPARFELDCGPFRDRMLEVVEFHGQEGMSELFSYSIELVTDLPFEMVELGLFGQRAHLRIQAEDGGRRRVHGIVRSVQSLDAVDDGSGRTRTHLSIELVPKLASLRECRRNRIFQDQTVEQIVSSILAEWGVSACWRLIETHATWSYCVQYEESDYDFISRILAGEGIFFFFSFESLARRALSALGDPLATAPMASMIEAVGDAVESETVVFGDSAHSYAIMSGTSPASLLLASALPAAAALGVTPTLRVITDLTARLVEEHVFRFGVRRVMAPRSILVRDYNPLHALHDPWLAASGTAVTPSLSSAVSAISDAVQDVLATATGQTSDDHLAEIYEHAPQRVAGGELTVLGARQSLDQHQRGRLVAEGASNCPRLTVGHVFSIDAHTVASLDGGYVVTRLRARGITPELRPIDDRQRVYEAEIEAIAHDLVARPARRARPSRQTMETAVVVGPASEEIFTDALGRIKVRFHWDRGDTAAESLSCWIRVAQAWSGPAYGAHFTPRVGMEVLVSFIGGDLDRPVVIGCVPNSSNPPLVTLPADKTRSGFRTRSSPGGSGYNELTFEDAIGGEEILLRAERDLNQHVLHDRTARIGRLDHVTVGEDSVLEVARDRTETIHRDDRLHVIGERDVVIESSTRLRVAGAADTEVGASMTTRVTGNVGLTVDGTSSTRVGGDATENISGSQRVHVAGDMDHDVLGTVRDHVHGEVHRQIDGSAVAQLLGCTVLAIGTPTERRALVTHVEGQSRAECSKELEILSQTSIRLQVGRSSILIGPDAIQICTPKLVLDGKATESFGESFHVTASKSAHLKGEGVFLTGAGGAEMSLKNEVKVGTTVKLGVAADPDACPARERSHAPPATIHLCDDDGIDVPDQPYLLRCDDGTQRAGVLDAEGKAEILGLGGTWTVEFPMLMNVSTTARAPVGGAGRGSTQGALDEDEDDERAEDPGAESQLASADAAAPIEANGPSTLEQFYAQLGAGRTA